MKATPQYEPEEGPLTDAQLRQIRKQVAHGKSEDAKRTGVYHPAAGVHRELQRRLDVRRKEVIARPRYSVAELLAGMKPGDMPTAEGWSDARPVGLEES